MIKKIYYPLFFKINYDLAILRVRARTVSIISHLTCKFKVRLHQRYFERDLKFSLRRFNVEKETETERVLSFA